jgi:hypothetical protein
MVVITAGAAFLCVPSAHGTPASVTQLLPIVESSWFWAGALGGPLPNADPAVPNGDLAVSGPTAKGQPPAETYLRFDLTGVPAGATVTALSLQLPVDSSATFTPVGVAAPVVVCAPEASWSASTTPQPFSQKPAESCPVDAPLLKSTASGHAYKVDIASMAQSWVGAPGSNFGIAVRDDPQNSTTGYQIAFGPAAALKQVEASVIYTLPEASPTPSGPPATVPPTTGPSATPIPTLPVSTPPPPVVTPLVTTPTAPSPGLAVPPPSSTTTSPPATTPAAVKAPSTAGSTPPTGFWIAGLLLAAVIAICWNELGRAPTRATVTRRRGVARLLAQRKA